MNNHTPQLQAARSRLAFRISETMVALSVPRASVYRLAKAGHLDLVKMGTVTHITADSVHALARTRSQEDDSRDAPG